MSDIASNLQQKFAEDIAAKYQAHKIFMFLILMFALYIDKSFDKIFSIWKILDKIKLHEVVDYRSGFFSHMTLQDFILSMFIVGMVCYVYEKYSFMIFRVTHGSVGDNYLNRLHEAAIANISNDAAQNMEFAKEVKGELKRSKLYVKRKAQHNEVLIAVTIAILLNFRFLDGVFEYSILICFSLFVLYNIRVSLKHYVTVYIPIYVQLSVLLGNKLSFPNVKDIAGHKESD